MHGIFVGEIQALEGAGRTCLRLRRRPTAPFQLKLDMARQCWDESRHCEISVKLGDHMGTEIGEYTESHVPLRGGVQPRPGAAPLRREPRARGPRHRRVQLDEGVRQRVGRPGARVLRGLDARRRGDPREDGLRLAAPPHRQRPGAPRAGARVPAHGRRDLQPRRLPRRGRREPDPARPPLPSSSPASPTRRTTRSPTLARESTEQAREMAEMATATARRPELVSRAVRGAASPSRPTRSRSIAVRRGRDRGARRGRAPRWSSFPPDVDIDARRRRGAVRAAHRAHVRRRRRHGACSGSRAANFEDNRRPAHFSRRPGPRRPRRHAAARQGPALRRLRRRAPRPSSSIAASGPPGTSTRSAGPSGSASPSGASASSTTSGSSTASPTSPTPRSSGCWDAPIDDLGRHPRDLQGDRRRRPRPLEGPDRPPPPEVAVATQPEVAARAAIYARSWAEIVSSRSIFGLLARGAGPRPRPCSVMSSESRWARAIVGRVPLLDHEESTTLGGGDEQVDVAAPRLAAGQHDVSGEHRRERRPRGPGERRTRR